MEDIKSFQKVFERIDAIVITSVHDIFINLKNTMKNDEKITYFYKNKSIVLGKFKTYYIASFCISNLSDISYLKEIISKHGIKKVYVLGLCAATLDSGLNVGDVLIARAISNIEFGEDKLYYYTEINSLHSYNLEKNNIIDDICKKVNIKAHLGVLGSSNRVFTNIEQVKKINKKIQALDYEQFGLYSFLATCKSVDWFVISEVCDACDSVKRESYTVEKCVKICEEFIEKTDNMKLQCGSNIFISSTCYDLSDIRSELAHFLQQYDKKVLWSESPDFPVDYLSHSHDVCIDNVEKADLMILIIDRRYGGKYSGRKYPKKEISITQYEVEMAQSLGIPIITFVRNTTWTEKAIYKHNKKQGIDIKTFYVDNPKVFDLIDFIQYSDANWIYQFENSVDLKLKLSTVLQFL